MNQSVVNSPVINYPDDISELTDTSPPQDYSEIRNIFKKTMQLASVEALKLKCKNNNIASYSKMKQSELVECLCEHFEKILDIVKLLPLTELKNICKYNCIKGFSNQKKSELIVLIMQLNASCTKSEFIYKFDSGKAIAVDTKEDVKLTKAELLSQLEKINEADLIIAKMEEDAKKIKDDAEKEAKKLKDKLEKEATKLKDKLEKEATKLKEDAEKILAEKILEKELVKKSKDETELEISKTKKQAIPKSIKKIVWDTYIGHDIIKHRCLCCKRVTIDNTNFHCGHVISEKDGGTLETGNLRPICAACNHSMGTENMIDFIKKYGLYVG